MMDGLNMQICYLEIAWSCRILSQRNHPKLLSLGCFFLFSGRGF